MNNSCGRFRYLGTAKRLFQPDGVNSAILNCQEFHLTFEVKCCTIVNKMNIEYTIQETDGFVIDYLLLTIDYFFHVNPRLSAV
jgi:hypothetical protein